MILFRYLVEVAREVRDRHAAAAAVELERGDEAGLVPGGPQALLLDVRDDLDGDVPGAHRPVDEAADGRALVAAAARRCARRAVVFAFSGGFARERGGGLGPRGAVERHGPAQLVGLEDAVAVDVELVEGRPQVGVVDARAGVAARLVLAEEEAD